MDSSHSVWASPQMTAAQAAGDLGGIVRLGRIAAGLSQQQLADQLHCSASTLSRLETGHQPLTNTAMLRRIAQHLAIPAHLLGLAAFPPQHDEREGTSARASTLRVATVAGNGDSGESGDNPMRRRTLMAAAGLTVPMHLLTLLDDALALSAAPAPADSTGQVAARLERARTQFDAGALTPLVGELPDLLASAHTLAGQAEAPRSCALLASCYDVATETLVKLGRSTASRITADRSTAWAARSGSPIAMAESARALGIVLRHEGRPRIAERVTLRAIGNLEATGLLTMVQADIYVRMLCTCAYNAAQAGDRERALDMIAEAERSATRLPALPSVTQPSTISPAQVTLYRVGVHWALGDAGTALHAGRDLRAGHFRTPERRARLYTDLARAWWQWGKPEQTAHQLLAAYHQAPSEVRYRPAIRSIVQDLAALHPQTSGVRELMALAIPATS
jgi:DNA-binding XRE family transcriptional regulator